MHKFSVKWQKKLLHEQNYVENTEEKNSEKKRTYKLAMPMLLEVKKKIKKITHTK